MDQIKTGKFIAELRRSKNLTQEELGRKLGVSNKTVSRWENGNYMPDIETLRLLSKEFGVSMEELLDGSRLSQKEAPGRPDPFSPAERADFWRRNWKRENLSWFVFWGILIGLFIIFASLFTIVSKYLTGFGVGSIFSSLFTIFFVAGIASLGLYIYFYNKMCIYVENNAYKINE